MAQADEKILIQIEVDNDEAVKALDKQNAEIDELEKSQKKLRDEGKKNTKEYQLQAQQLNKLRASRKNLVEGIKSENNTLARTKARLREVTIAIDKQSTSTEVGRAKLKSLREEQARLNTTLSQSEQKGKVFTRNVGNYGSALQSVIPQVGLFNTTLLSNPFVAIGAALVGLTSQVFAFGRTFDTSMSKVQAVTGATSDEMEGLRDSAIQLGEASKFTATEVANLQVELGKLGFTTEEIEQSTGAIINLATAADTELARAAEVTASVLNQFNLTTEETNRVVDVMAESFSSSALDLEKFATGLGIVGPAGNAVGASLESVTAILAKTADNGIDASTSATALRNIFIDLSDKGLSWEDAMQQINDSQNKLSTANELFGKRGAVVANVIAQNSEEINKLDVAFQNAAGSAQEMADIVSNNLQGDLDRLSSSWEGLIARLSAGGGKAFRYFIVTLQFGVDLLKQLGSDAIGLLSPTGIMAILLKSFSTEIKIAFDKTIIGLREGYLELLRGAKSAMEALGFSTENITSQIKQQRLAIFKLNQDIAAQEEIEEVKRQEEGLTAWQQYRENLARIDREYDDKKKADKIARDQEQSITEIQTTQTTEQVKTAIVEDETKKRDKVIEQSAKKEIATRQQVANAQISLASTVLKGVSQFLKKGSAEQKAFAIADATINTAKGITNAMAYGVPPLNFINAAAVGAAGAAQVASIASTSTGSSGGVTAPSPTGGTTQPQVNTNAIDQQVQQQEALIAATESIGLSISVTEINDVQNNVRASEQTATI